MAGFKQFGGRPATSLPRNPSPPRKMNSMPHLHRVPSEQPISQKLPFLSFPPQLPQPRTSVPSLAPISSQTPLPHQLLVPPTLSSTPFARTLNFPTASVSEFPCAFPDASGGGSTIYPFDGCRTLLVVLPSGVRPLPVIQVSIVLNPVPNRATILIHPIPTRTIQMWRRALKCSQCSSIVSNLLNSVGCAQLWSIIRRKAKCPGLRLLPSHVDCSIRIAERACELVQRQFPALLIQPAFHFRSLPLSKRAQKTGGLLDASGKLFGSFIPLISNSLSCDFTCRLSACHGRRDAGSGRADITRQSVPRRSFRSQHRLL